MLTTRIETGGVTNNGETLDRQWREATHFVADRGEHALVVVEAEG